MQLSDDCFAHAGGLLPLDEALAVIRQRLRPVAGTETVALGAATGRVLADAAIAPVDVPAHDNSAVDGYAVHFDDLVDDGPTRLPVTGRVAAGHALDRAAGRGEAIRILTGGPMPTGPDTVAMQEDCRREGERVVIPNGLRRGANRRARGEDIRERDTVLAAGRRLRPEDVGVLASLGQGTVTVRRRLHVGVFSSGDEVCEPGAARRSHGIFDANRHTLLALLDGLGCAASDLGILPDDSAVVHDRLTGAAGFDLLVSSGGASVGEEDHIQTAIRQLGPMHFWKLAIKPGRPVLMGQAGRTPLIGLPGNPAAMMVTFLMIARPTVLRLAGAATEETPRYPVTADFSHRKKTGRREFLRVRLAGGPYGPHRARKYHKEGAGILMSFVAADGLVELAEGVTDVMPGDTVSFIPLNALR